MSFYVKLAAFWVTVFAGLWLLSRFPNSSVSRLAFSWHGPVPTLGELKSRYPLRWSVYALGWLAQFLVVFSCGLLAVSWYPALEQEMWFMAFWSFAIPVLSGMAFLGALLTLLGALKAKLLGPNPIIASDNHEISV